MGLFSTECDKCGSKNHATSDCPHGFFSSECDKCGGKDHATSDCPHGFFSFECYKCGSKDHATSDCPHGFFSSACNKCGSKNHATSDCPHGFFSSECDKCGSKDHATSDCPHGLFSSECNNCGSKNHAASDCPRWAEVSNDKAERLVQHERERSAPGAEREAAAHETTHAGAAGQESESSSGWGWVVTVILVGTVAFLDEAAKQAPEHGSRSLPSGAPAAPPVPRPPSRFLAPDALPPLALADVLPAASGMRVGGTGESRVSRATLISSSGEFLPYTVQYVPSSYLRETGNYLFARRDVALYAHPQQTGPRDSSVTVAAGTPVRIVEAYSVVDQPEGYFAERQTSLSLPPSGGSSDSVIAANSLFAMLHGTAGECPLFSFPDGSWRSLCWPREPPLTLAHLGLTHVSNGRVQTAFLVEINSAQRGWTTLFTESEEPFAWLAADWLPCRTIQGMVIRPITEPVCPPWPTAGRSDPPVR